MLAACGFDPDRIGVFGSSAGGQLALLLGTTADSGEPTASAAMLRESSRVAAVVAFFRPRISLDGDAARFEGPDLERASAAMVQWFERHLGSAAK